MGCNHKHKQQRQSSVVPAQPSRGPASNIKAEQISVQARQEDDNNQSLFAFTNLSFWHEANLH